MGSGERKYRSRRMFAKLSAMLQGDAALPSIDLFARITARTACRLLSCAALALLLKPVTALCAPAPTHRRRPRRLAGSLDAARLQAADSEPQNWYTGGRDQDGTYYSPLTMLNAQNVGRLGFAWQYDLGAPMRGQEATPIVIDGVMYTSGTWGYVYAVDAATGRELWRYDPKPTILPPEIRAAISSTAASRCGRATCTSLRSTDGCTRSMPRPAPRSGKSTPSPITSCPIPAPAHRRSPATSSSSETADRTWDAAVCAAT